MKYLVDTNVISETIKKKPNVNVLKFLENTNPSYLCISVLTLGELRKGIEKIKDSTKKKQKLILWFENEMIEFFQDRVLPIDKMVADKWGFIIGNIDKPRPAIDSLLAATAIIHNLKVVTRNKNDFLDFPVEIINPW